jgi:hypothetical protein
MLKIYIYLFQFSDASNVTGHHDLNKRKKHFRKDKKPLENEI